MTQTLPYERTADAHEHTRECLYAAHAHRYLHRIGRSGRFGTLGAAVTIVTEQELPGLLSLLKRCKTTAEPLPAGPVTALLSEHDMDDDSKDNINGGNGGDVAHDRVGSSSRGGGGGGGGGGSGGGRGDGESVQGGNMCDSDTDDEGPHGSGGGSTTREGSTSDDGGGSRESAVPSDKSRAIGQGQPGKKLTWCKWEQGEFAAQGCWAHRKGRCAFLHRDEAELVGFEDPGGEPKLGGGVSDLGSGGVSDLGAGGGAGAGPGHGGVGGGDGAVDLPTLTVSDVRGKPSNEPSVSTNVSAFAVNAGSTQHSADVTRRNDEEQRPPTVVAGLYPTRVGGGGDAGGTRASAPLRADNGANDNIAAAASAARVQHRASELPASAVDDKVEAVPSTRGDDDASSSGACGSQGEPPWAARGPLWQASAHSQWQAPAHSQWQAFNQPTWPSPRAPAAASTTWEESLHWGQQPTSVHGGSWRDVWLEAAQQRWQQACVLHSWRGSY
jgi:hypothetical protein